MKYLDQNPLSIRKEILVLGKLTEADMQIIRLCRTKENKLGFGYQIAFVKIRNYFPKQNAFEIDPSILDFVSYQLNYSIDLISQYQYRRSVIQDHQNRIRQHLNLQEYGNEAKKALTEHILEQAQQTDQISLLVPKAQCFLKTRAILQPALSELRRLVGSCRNRVWKLIESRLDDQLKEP